MESQFWGHYDEGRRHESADPDRGERLKVSLPFVMEILKKLNRDLIIQVQIERHRRYQPYDSGGKDDDERISTQAKLYLFDHDGKFRTI